MWINPWFDGNQQILRDTDVVVQNVDQQCSCTPKTLLNISVFSYIYEVAQLLNLISQLISKAFQFCEEILNVISPFCEKLDEF